MYLACHFSFNIPLVNCHKYLAPPILIWTSVNILVTSSLINEMNKSLACVYICMGLVFSVSFWKSEYSSRKSHGPGTWEPLLKCTHNSLNSIPFLSLFCYPWSFSEKDSITSTFPGKMFSSLCTCQCHLHGLRLQRRERRTKGKLSGYSDNRLWRHGSELSATHDLDRPSLRGWSPQPAVTLWPSQIQWVSHLPRMTCVRHAHLGSSYLPAPRGQPSHWELWPRCPGLSLCLPHTCLHGDSALPQTFPLVLASSHW